MQCANDGHLDLILARSNMLAYSWGKIGLHGIRTSSTQPYTIRQRMGGLVRLLFASVIPKVLTIET